MEPVGPLCCSLAECLPNRQESRHSRAREPSMVSVEKVALGCPPLRMVSKVNVTTHGQVLLPLPMSSSEQKYLRMRWDFGQEMGQVTSGPLESFLPHTANIYTRRFLKLGSSTPSLVGRSPMCSIGTILSGSQEHPDIATQPERDRWPR